MKILIIEDDLSLINGLSFAIKKQGYELDTARTSFEADTLTVYIRRLRTKIEDNPSEPKMIITVRGMGYKWQV